MSPRSRTEIAQIRTHLAALKKSPWLSPSCGWWPNYLFHCTDILNAVSILRYSEFLSRQEATASGRLQVDIASPEIIAQTELEWQNYVRLYFRPRTPTQYRNEGFRTLDQRQYGAHCPIPVYFLLDAVSVLSREDCYWTDGNVAAGAHPCNRVAALAQIRFDLVYHDKWFESDKRGTIIYHRNAEVLLPKRLDLRSLRLICCRSQAEYQTLITLLPPGVLARWVDKIGVRPNLRLFFGQWSFVEEADMDSQRVGFRFNRGTETPGPFAARVEIVETPTGLRYVWEHPRFMANATLDLKLVSVKNPQDYTARLLLDDQLAFAGRHQLEGLPF